MNLRHSTSRANGVESTVSTPSSGVASPTRRLFLSRSAALSLAGGSAALLLGGNGSLLHAAKAPKAKKSGQGDEFMSIEKHEADHVAFLVAALGEAARPKPTFQNLEQAKFQDFALVAQALENTGVGAYLGAAPLLSSADLLAAAGSIATVEARHAGYVNTLLADPITSTSFNTTLDPSFETALTSDQVVAAAGGFIASLNGGPPVGYAQEVSTDNDLDILNFALALEYLEAEFYAINVPKFFKARRT